MLNKDALEYVATKLAQPNIKEFHGLSYSDKALHEIPEPSIKDPIKVNTLTAINDYLKGNLDSQSGVIVHVATEKSVAVFTQVRQTDLRRNFLINATAICPTIDFGLYMPAEDFIVHLQTLFVQNETAKKMLSVAGNVQSEAIKVLNDDGITQKVTVKSGVARVGNVTLNNPVKIAPYRTFPEIEQPESNFVWRARKFGDNIEFALFEADGGKWKIDAISGISAWLSKALGGVEDVSILA